MLKKIEKGKREREKKKMRPSFVPLHKRDENEHIASQLDRISCVCICVYEVMY
jgi:hypothetical protein